MDACSQSLTGLLAEWKQGNQSVIDQLLPLVYDDLRRIARAQFRLENVGHTLQTTALVNELYLELVRQKRLDFPDRAHFLAFAARAIRNMLIDHARAKRARKRGGDNPRVDWSELDDLPADDLLFGKAKVDLLALDAALGTLSKEHPELSEIVELKFFGGLTEGEVAEALSISVATVARRFRVARAWLYRELTGAPGDSSG